MVTKAGSRGKRKRASINDVPKDLADRWELLTRVTSERLFEGRRKIKEAIGQRPYKGFPVAKGDLAERWAQIAHDQDALVELFQENAKFKEDGTILIPKELLKIMHEENRKRVDGGFE